MTPQTWLITGGSGFLGKALLQALSTHPEIRPILIGRNHPATVSNTHFIHCNLALENPWPHLLPTIQPTHIIHLAGTTPPASDAELHQGNVQITQNLVQALNNYSQSVKLIHAGSAAELGEVPPSFLPVDETYHPVPVSTYGQTKWLASQLALSLTKPHAPVIARFFNLVGPGQPASQVFGKYARWLASLPDASATSDLPTINTAGLLSRRDFIDTRDAAQAIIHLASSGYPGHVYNVASGQSVPILDGIKHLVTLSGKSVQFIHEPTTQNGGPVDSIADIRKITTHTPWRPTISLKQSLTDLWSAQMAVDRL